MRVYPKTEVAAYSGILCGAFTFLISKDSKQAPGTFAEKVELQLISLWIEAGRARQCPSTEIADLTLENSNLSGRSLNLDTIFSIESLLFFADPMQNAYERLVLFLPMQFCR